MARHKEFNYDEALCKAMHVFWDMGYEAATLAHLTKATGLSKSSLYQTFGSKKELYAKALELYSKLKREKTREAFNKSDSPLNDIRDEMVRIANRPEGQKSCLLVKSVLDIIALDKEIYELAKHNGQKQNEVWRNAVIRAQKSGDINPKLDSEEITQYLVTIALGFWVKGALPTDPEINERAIDRFLQPIIP